MRILNFGSINIDHVYSVEHFARPGETLNSLGYRQFAGGKGFNQSIALAHAGANVYHAGKIGHDDTWLKEHLRKAGVDTSFVEVSDTPTGHAVIQVNEKGENSIVLCGGANQEISESDVSRILPHFSAGDYLLLQNETANIPGIITLGSGRGLYVVFNPAPMTSDVVSYPLNLVDLFVVNKVEATELTGEIEPERILTSMRERYPKAGIVLTLGDKGAAYTDARATTYVEAKTVSPVDTTAAGDTFIGFFLAELSGKRDVKAALKMGCRAAGICVMRPGASDSIPTATELERKECVNGSEISKDS